MRYLVTLAVASAALAFAGVAAAGAPLRATFTFDNITFQDPFLSEACGTNVYITLNGTIKATLFVDKDGKISREIDTQPGLHLKYSNDAGDSISFPWALISHTSYSGTTVGSPATITLTGNVGSFTGLVGPGNGRLVLSGTVVFVDENGVPITAFTEVVSMSGNFTGETAKICAALS